jgi:hypothetical protein
MMQYEGGGGAKRLSERLPRLSRRVDPFLFKDIRIRTISYFGPLKTAVKDTIEALGFVS